MVLTRSNPWAEKIGEGCEQFDSIGRVTLEDSPFNLGRSAFLCQNVRGDKQLSGVMEQRCPAQPV